MKLAGDFLQRFQKLTPPNGSVRKALSASIREETGIVVAQSNINVSRLVAYVQCPSIEKNVIRLARTAVLKSLYEKVPTARESVRDIR